jgi:hypothetical protein
VQGKPEHGRVARGGTPVRVQPGRL